MADYDKPTGTAGTLRIRQAGGLIELWVLCSDGATNSGQVDFDTTINGYRQIIGATLPAGFGSKKIRSATQGVGSQTVVLNMPATGTSGLGGPTNHSHAFASPSDPPDAPGSPVASAISDNDATLTWTAAANNGAAITNYGLYVSEDPGFSSYVYQAWVGTVLTKTLTNLLKPGTTYYARTRAQNAAGTGPYSATSSFQTVNLGCYVSDGATWKPGEFQVDDGTTFAKAEVLVSNGTAWIAPT